MRRALPARSRIKCPRQRRLPFDLPQESCHPDEAEDPQDLDLRERQARKQISPSEVSEEVGAPRRCGHEAVGEVDEEDEAEQAVHDTENVLQVGVATHDIGEDKVDNRQHRQDANKDLIACVLQFAAGLSVHGGSLALETSAAATDGNSDRS